MTTVLKLGGTGGFSLPFTFDYSEWTILDDGNAIVSADVPDVVGLTIGSPVISDDGKAVQVWVSGSTVGSYALTCDATTDHSPTPAVMPGCWHIEVVAC